MTTADYIWGSNGVAANYGMQLLVANAFKPNPRYVETALDNLHYILGRNTFSISWVTQLGANPYKHPHHRPSGADGIDDPWPGMLSGGPNRSRQDPDMTKLLPADLPAGQGLRGRSGGLRVQRDRHQLAGAPGLPAGGRAEVGVPAAPTPPTLRERLAPRDRLSQ